jgi:hypothetical protein
LLRIGEHLCEYATMILLLSVPFGGTMLSLYEMERQILGYYNLATKTERVAGITWYADALSECEMLASLYTYQLQQ